MSGQVHAVITRRSLTVLALVVGSLMITEATAQAPEPVVLASVAMGQPAPATTCDHVAGDGERDAVQRLVDALAPGQTGCLRAGTYTQDMVEFHRGGRAGAPIRLTSYPGERARLVGGFIYVPHGHDHVIVSDVDINGNASDQVTVQIMAADTTVERVGVTNDRRGSCMILGSTSGYGQAERTIVRDSRFYDCGDPAEGNQDHAIYLENVDGAQILDNVIWNTSAWAIHLYPNARNTTVAHNVLDGNGSGVIFGGNARVASSQNVVERNLITNSTADHNVKTYWGGPVGIGNVLRDNCLYNGKLGDIGWRDGLTTAANTLADPRYLDRERRDYRLQSDSPCLSVVGYDTVSRLARAPVARPRLRLERRRRGSSVLRGRVSAVPAGARVTLEVARGRAWQLLTRTHVRAGGRIAAAVPSTALPRRTVFVRALTDGAPPSLRARWRAPVRRHTG